MLNRELTKLETLYRRLMFAYNHYDGELEPSLKKNTELLLEMRALRMSGEMAEDFCEDFEALWFDQCSKWRDMHENYYLGATYRLRELGFELPARKAELS